MMAEAAQAAEAEERKKDFLNRKIVTSAENTDVTISYFSAL